MSYCFKHVVKIYLKMWWYMPILQG